MTDQRAKKPKLATPASWKPGVSGNPNGRPRTGLAFAERVRERVDPDLVINLAMRVADDESMPADARLSALWPLIDRGFVKPPTASTIDLTTTRTPERDWTSVSVDERRALLERIRSVPTIGTTTDTTQPSERRLPNAPLPEDDTV
ncbi:MAG: hypothetical protein NT062_34025 [Proteobacteria bacterium]|nr:hypothetical protein [Pseudomonadota bacterium]